MVDLIWSHGSYFVAFRCSCGGGTGRWCGRGLLPREGTTAREERRCEREQRRDERQEAEGETQEPAAEEPAAAERRPERRREERQAEPTAPAVVHPSASPVEQRIGVQGGEEELRELRRLREKLQRERARVEECSTRPRRRGCK